MRILYGVVGEGMGHATRSRVVLEHLLNAGHQVRVVVSGRAHGFMADRFAGRANLSVQEIHGLSLRFDGNTVDKSETLLTNLEALPVGIMQNVEAYQKVAEDGFSPELVVSDFESFAFLYGLNHRLPVVSIDNMQVINRCAHPPEVLGESKRYFRLARWIVKAKLPGAYHYLVSSFFFPPVRKERTTLVPPILRPEILAAKREPGDHILVYQSSATATEVLLPLLERLPHRFVIYGTGREGAQGNLTFKGFSETGFVDDLRTARAVVAGGGYSLMGEAVHLRVPMFSVPVEKQFEQILNARYLARLGYGAWDETLSEPKLTAFLGRLDEHAHALHEGYTPMNNDVLFGCVDELIRNVSLDEPAADRLESPALGKYFGPPLCDDHAH
jgi:uncharacterized protein (TIGR00661 family)